MGSLEVDYEHACQRKGHAMHIYGKEKSLCIAWGAVNSTLPESYFFIGPSISVVA